MLYEHNERPVYNHSAEHNSPPTSPLILSKISSDLHELQKWSCWVPGEQLLHLLHTSYATGKITYLPCTYRSVVAKNNGLSLSQCTHKQRKWCPYIVWKFREIQCSDFRVDRAYHHPAGGAEIAMRGVMLCLSTSSLLTWLRCCHILTHWPTHKERTWSFGIRRNTLVVSLSVVHWSALYVHVCKGSEKILNMLKNYCCH